MATKIVTKNSSTASAVPTASDLVQGELAVNVADKRLFTEDNGGAIVELGINPAAEITANAGIALPDSQKATFGAGDDLEIYHDGTDSYISEVGAGGLVVQARDAITFEDGTSGDNYLYMQRNSKVELYHAGAAKLATTSTGIDVTGTATMDGLTVNSGTANNVATFTSTDAYSLIKFEDNDTTTETTLGALDNDMVFRVGAAERLRIDGSSGNVGIGNSAPLGRLTISNAAGTNAPSTVTAANTYLQLGSDDYGPSNNGKFMIGFGFTDATNTNSPAYIGYEEASTSGDTYGDLTFYTRSVTTDTAPTERMRIDSSGNLLVGKTSYNSALTGGQIGVNGIGAFTSNNVFAGIFNRTGTDGTLVDFRKDGTTVGSIGTINSALYIGTLSENSGITFQGTALQPTNGAQNRVDNTNDIGSGTYRWDDIYATNGTIQTSDRNEKQDIAELSDAEQRVAVACKGLLRKFRWKDSVAEKGDDARIHFGIIAQDLQAAFVAEGLDAGDYAMFTSTTWTDEETNEEKTRMGVRYSELLAFIISAI